MNLTQAGLRRHLLFRLIMPVTAVAVLALILSLVLTLGAYRRWVRAGILDEDRSRITQASAALSAFHNWLIPYMHTLRDNHDVMHLYSDSPPSLLSLSRGLDQLDTATVTGSKLHSVYLYNRLADFSLSTSRGLQDIPDMDPSIARLIKESLSYKPYRYHPLVLNEENGPLKVISLMVGDLPLQGNLPLQRGMIVNIDTEALARDYFSGMARRGTFRIFDSLGRELLSMGEGDGAELPQAVFSDQGNVILHRDGTQRAVSWLHNPDIDWWLVLESRFDRGVYSTGNQDIWIPALILLVLSAALAITYRAAWGLYLPLQSLIPHMNLGNLSPLEQSGSVFSEISLSVRELGNRLNQDKLRRERAQIRDFLEGSLSPRESARLIGRFPEILNSRPPWRVAAISFRQPGGMEQEAVEYLIVASDQGEESPFLIPYLEAGRSIGLGPECPRASDLPAGARDARIALAYRFLHGTGRIIRFDELDTDPESPYDLPTQSVRHLLAKINTGRSEAAYRCLRDIIDDLAEHRPEDFRMTVTFVSYEIRRDLLPLSQLDPAFAAVLDAHLEEAQAAETLQQAEAAFRELIATALSRQQHRCDSRTEETIDQVYALIARDLADPGLCPDSLASEIGLSTSYLREIFKRETGRSLSRLIQDRRIEECRRLLAETDLSVKEISLRSGYRNYNSFFSTFRRVVGLTPLEYRESLPETAGSRD